MHDGDLTRFLQLRSRVLPSRRAFGLSQKAEMATHRVAQPGDKMTSYLLPCPKTPKKTQDQRLYQQNPNKFVTHQELPSIAKWMTFLFNIFNGRLDHRMIASCNWDNIAPISTICRSWLILRLRVWCTLKTIRRLNNSIDRAGTAGERRLQSYVYAMLCTPSCHYNWRGGSGGVIRDPD